MSTQITTSTVLRRVAARTGVGMWRQRGGILIGLVLIAGITGYLALGPTGSGSSMAASISSSPAAAASNDCADTTMAAIADTSSAAAQQAYQCMDPTVQQRVPEQTFVDQLQAQKLPDVSSVARVGDYQNPAGGSMVYYAVSANNQSVGYIVYLGQDGKVLKVQ